MVQPPTTWNPNFASIFEGQPTLQNKTEIPIKTRGPIWVPGSYMGASKNRGTPKWMVYDGKPY